MIKANYHIFNLLGNNLSFYTPRNFLYVFGSALPGSKGSKLKLAKKLIRIDFFFFSGIF